MTALLSKVLCYTMKLIEPKVATMPNLGGAMGCHRVNGGGCLK